MSTYLVSAYSIGTTYRCIDEEIAFSFDVSAMLLMLYILLRVLYHLFFKCNIPSSHNYSLKAEQAPRL